MHKVLALGATALFLAFSIPAQAAGSTDCFEQPGQAELCIPTGSLPPGYSPKPGDTRKRTIEGDDGSVDISYAGYTCRYWYGRQNCSWQSAFEPRQVNGYTPGYYPPPPVRFFLFSTPHQHSWGGYHGRGHHRW